MDCLVAAIITAGELQICVTNYVQNHVAGSTLLSFSDDEWMALIPSMGFRMELSAQETVCDQNLRSTERIETSQNRFRTSHWLRLGLTSAA